MEKDDSGSLFDKAADMERKRRLLKKKKKRPETLSAPKSSAPSESVGKDEFADMFKRMREMRDDLEGQILDLYSKAGVSRSTAEEFFSDAKNVPEGARTEISRLETQLTKILGVRAKKISQQFKDTKDSEKRKKKMIGQRRKWIQM